MPPIWRLIPGIKSRGNEGWWESCSKVVCSVCGIHGSIICNVATFNQCSVPGMWRNHRLLRLEVLKNGWCESTAAGISQQEFPIMSRVRSFNRESCLFCSERQFPASRQPVLRAALQDRSLLTFRLLSLLGNIAVSMCLQPQCWNSNHDRKFH